MELYVIRHGIAEDRGPDGSDASRALTEVGRERMADGVRGLRALDVRLDAIFTSPLIRAMETAEILSQGLPGPEPEILSLLGTGGARAESILREIVGAGERVALVGHEPTLGELVSVAIAGVATGATPLKKGSVARVDLPPSLRPGSGQLAWFLAPKQLRALGAAR